jgi:signal transduction histidine kinase
MNSVSMHVFEERDESSRGSPREPGRRDRAVFWLTLAFWLSNFTILTAGNYLGGRGDFLATSLIRGGLIAFGLLLCYVIHVALSRLGNKPFKTRAITAAILAPVAAEIFAWASFFALATIDPARLGKPVNWSVAIKEVAFWTWFFLAWAGLYLALNYSMDAKEEEVRSSELRSLAQAAKLNALHNQVNPHFLFNSLNSISALVLEGHTKAADQMIGRLANFFRRSLAVDAFHDIPLSEEIELQKQYLEIEQLRFPDLELRISCSPAAAGAAVPALILQPLVENAVKYGVARSEPPARVEIEARSDGPSLLVIVSDRGRTKDGASIPGGAGIGLKNVRERLEQRFGSQQSVTVRRGEPAGFEVILKMPLVPSC